MIGRTAQTLQMEPFWKALPKSEICSSESALDRHSSLN
jgi:hypothetical protein